MLAGAFGIVLVALLALDSLDVLDYPWDAPDLPSFARPPGEQVESYPGCGGSGDRPPCRTVVFGVNDDIESVRRSLEREFVTRGWMYSQATSNWFSARSPNEDVCVGYSWISREQAAENARRFQTVAQRREFLTTGFWSEYSLRVSVTVHDCSFKG
jgi:hypothetical protein